jgi:hypothetical protein
MGKRKLYFLLIFLVIPLTADTLVVGTPQPGNGNCIPFGCPASFVANGYHQMYDASLFPGPMLITGVEFFNNEHEPGVSPVTQGSYWLSLSTVTTPQPPPYGQWWMSGADEMQLFSGWLAGTVPASGLFLGGQGSFLYDPAQGNLMLNLGISSPDPDSLLFLDFATGTPGLYRQWQDGLQQIDGSAGALVTGFVYTPAESGVPEPATVGTMILSLTGLVLLRRRRTP